MIDKAPLLGGVVALGALVSWLVISTEPQVVAARDLLTQPFEGDPRIVPWSESEQLLLARLSLTNVGPLQPDPTNHVSDDPKAAKLGQRVFFDTRFSANGKVSCATCHQPEKAFTDGLTRGRGLGESGRNTRGIVGAASSPWQYWDGRRDSLWAQALSPLEDPAEHGMTRAAIVLLFFSDAGYLSAYGELFGPPPDLQDRARFPAGASPAVPGAAAAAWAGMSSGDQQTLNRVFVNIGKTIAAYERKLQPGPGHFDAYVDHALTTGSAAPADAGSFGAKEIAGLRLFITRGRCIECHNGALFTNNEFHNTGVLSAPGELPDRSRVEGAKQVLDQEFNCLSQYSDDHACDELRFMRKGTSLIGATRTPTLRNVSATGPYMHKGQVGTLAEVISHYNTAPEALIGHNEAKPLNLSPREERYLVSFLQKLDAALPDKTWLMSPGGSRD